MNLVRYVNIYETVYDEEDQPYEEVTKENITLPIILKPYKITSIEPYYTRKGKPYKNVSIITYDSGEKFKVVGNYKNINQHTNSNNNPHIGF